MNTSNNNRQPGSESPACVCMCVFSERQENNRKGQEMQPSYHFGEQERGRIADDDEKERVSIELFVSLFFLSLSSN